MNNNRAFAQTTIVKDFCKKNMINSNFLAAAKALVARNFSGIYFLKKLSADTTLLAKGVALVARNFSGIYFQKKGTLI